MNKPVCVLSQPLEFLPFSSLSRLCKSSAGALQPASGAEISTSSQLCARLSPLCCSQELAGNQFKMFHFQTPPHNPWISRFALTEAGAGAFNHFSVGRAKDIPWAVNSPLPLLPQGRSPGSPCLSCGSDFLALLPHHPFTSAHTLPCPQLHLKASPSTSPEPGTQQGAAVWHFMPTSPCPSPCWKATATAPRCHVLRENPSHRSPDHDHGCVTLSCSEKTQQKLRRFLLSLSLQILGAV